MNFIARLFDRTLWFPNQPMGPVTLRMLATALSIFAIRLTAYGCFVAMFGPWGVAIAVVDVVLWWWTR